MKIIIFLIIIALLVYFYFNPFSKVDSKKKIVEKNKYISVKQKNEYIESESNDPVVNKFHTDFFNFRDKIHLNTDLHKNPLAKIELTAGETLQSVYDKSTNIFNTNY